MIEMPVAQNDVFDRLRIDTDFADVANDPVDIGFLSCVEQDVPFRRRQQPHRDIARSNIIKVVEHLEGFDLLKLHIIGAGDSIGFAERFRRCLSCGRSDAVKAEQKHNDHQTEYRSFHVFLPGFGSLTGM